jgi:hypothetical protein
VHRKDSRFEHVDSDLPELATFKTYPSGYGNLSGAEEKPWRGSTGADNLEGQWHVAGPTDPGSSAPAGLELKTLCLTHGHRQLLVVSRALFSRPHETHYSPEIQCLCMVGSAAMTPEQDVSWLLASHLSLPHSEPRAQSLSRLRAGDHSYSCRANGPTTARVARRGSRGCV